ncbi:MAG: hypothetical protein ACKVT0_10340 [Planctomycetaceae bacterium]
MTLSARNTKRWILFTLWAALLGSISPVLAQSQFERGFDYHIPAAATGDELSRQPGLWMMAVDFKTLRMIKVDVTDPLTGEKKQTRITYLVYRAWNKQLGQEPDADDPQNEFDPPRGPEMFMPEFTLVTSDNDRQEIYVDEIIPEAQLLISQRERQKLLNSIELIQPVPEAFAGNERPANMIYGVAMWKNVDPQADRFTVYMTGFTNSYLAVEGPDGDEILLKRTVRQSYWRPGDELNLFEKEIRTEGEAEWIYRAIDGSIEQAAVAPLTEKAAEAEGENTDDANPADEPAEEKTEEEPKEETDSTDDTESSDTKPEDGSSEDTEENNG